MPPKTRWSNLQLIAPVENAGRLARRVEVAPSSSTDANCATVSEENTLDGGELMMRLLEEAPDRLVADQDSLSVKRLASDPVVERPVSRTRVRQLMRGTVNRLSDQLDARLAKKTGDFLIRIMENIDNDHNIAHLRESLKRATPSMLTSIWSDEGWWDAFETAGIEETTSGPMALAIATALIRKEKILAPKAKLVVDIAKKEVSEAAQQSISLAPSSPPSSQGDSSSSDEEWKHYRYKESLSCKEKISSSSDFDDRGIHSRQRSIRSYDGLSTSRSEEQLKALK